MSGERTEKESEQERERKREDEMPPRYNDDDEGRGVNRGGRW